MGNKCIICCIEVTCTEQAMFDISIKRNIICGIQSEIIAEPRANVLLFIYLYYRLLSGYWFVMVVQLFCFLAARKPCNATDYAQFD